MKHLASALFVTLVAAGTASAQIVVDGTADASYGPALSVQNTNTGFGDSNDPDPQTSGGPLEEIRNGSSLYDAGSEIDAVYGKIDGGFLYIFIAGNLEDNFNKLDIFIDSEAGVGQNVINGANLPTGVDAFCCGGFGTTSGALQNMNGMTFDAGFAPDYYLTTANGNESTGDPLAFPPVAEYIATVHFAELNNGPSGANIRVGGVLDPFGQQKDGLGNDYLGLGVIMDQNNNLFDDPNNPSDYVPAAGQEIALHEFFEALDTLGDPTNVRNHRDMLNTIGMLMAVNNSNAYGDDGGEPAVANAGGVIGNGATNEASPEFVALAAAVTTGFEYAIPLAAIGNPTGDIKITAMINNGSHNYLSNQVAGVGVLQGNLGGDGAGGFTGDLAGINFASIAGNQFVTISQGGLAGDLNGDGFVGLADLDIILGNWNANVTPGSLPDGDPSGDGFVGLADLDTVLGNWNAGTPPTGAVVPEPATLALLGLGGLAMMRRR